MSTGDATSRLPAASVGAEASTAATILRPDQANVVALVTDPPMFEEIRVAVEGRHRIWRAESPTHAAELLLSSNRGVLLLDAAVTGPATADIIRLLRQQLPDLPIVVAGRRDDEGALSGLISTGDVFRFLHKPLSTERARTFIDGAVRRQSSNSEAATQRGRPGDDGPASARPLSPSPATTAPHDRGRRMTRIGRAGFAIAACAAVAGAWLAVQRARPIRPDLPQGVATTMPVPNKDRDRLIAAADAALDAGRLAEPRGDNAIELYRQVLRDDSTAAVARQGLQRTGQALLGRAEQALYSGDLLTAAAMIDAARFAEPPADRLRALQDELQSVRARMNARPPAGTIQTLDPAMVSQIAQQEARALLGRATGRMAAGHLIGGPQSAAALLEAARKSNPSDPAVVAAVGNLSGLLVLRAREALAAGRYSEATRWTHEVEALGHDPNSVVGLAADIDAARLAAARQESHRLLELANQRIAEGRLLEPEADSAQHYVDLLRAADADFPGLDDTTRDLCSRLLAQVREQVRQRQWSDAERGLGVAASLGADAAALRHTTGVLERVRGAEHEPPFTAESELHRTHHVAATYPARAASAGLEGVVELEFTIGTDGATRNLTVLTSAPPGIFDEAALEAVTQWQYRPLQVDGIAVPSRTRVRLRFLRGDR